MEKTEEYISVIKRCKLSLNDLVDKMDSEKLPEDLMEKELEKIKEGHKKFLEKSQEKCSHPVVFEEIYNGIVHIFCKICLKTVSIKD